MEDTTKVTERELKFAGFHDRLLASIIDSALLIFILSPVMRIFVHPPSKPYDLFMDFNNRIIDENQYSQQLLDYVYNQGGLREIGLDMIIQFIVFGVAIVAFWYFKTATPGKMLMRMRVVDEKTWQKPTTVQLVIRYLSYFVSTIPFFLGFVWVAFDKKKQGWHDKIAGTVVIIEKKKKKS